MSTTPAERAVVEAADKQVAYWEKLGISRSFENQIFLDLIDAVIRYRSSNHDPAAKPQMVRCANRRACARCEGCTTTDLPCYRPEPVPEPQLVRCHATDRCRSTRCLHRIPHKMVDECLSALNCADFPKCRRDPCSPEPVPEERMVPEAEVRRRERKAHIDGWRRGWERKAIGAADNYWAIEGSMARDEAEHRYPDPTATDCICDPKHSATDDACPACHPAATQEPAEPDPQRGLINVEDKVIERAAENLIIEWRKAHELLDGDLLRALLWQLEYAILYERGTLPDIMQSDSSTEHD